MKLEPDTPRHKKKAGKRKPYRIEYRSTGPSVWGNGWHPWFRGYETEERRDEALKGLRESYKGIGWEFRAK